MMKRFLVVAALSLLEIPLSAYCQAAVNPVQIVAIGIHYGGYVIYRYQVKNNGAQNISRIVLGYTGPEDSSFNGFVELPDDPAVTLPMAGQWFPAAIISRPDGWGSRLISTADEGDVVGIDWVEGSYAKQYWPRRLQDANAPQVYEGGKAIAPGQTSGDFSVKLERPDFTYVHGYASVAYGADTIPIPVEKGDTVPPVLAIALSPATVWPPDNKLIPVTAAISATDNYDPQPEIKLESITCNEPLAPGDVTGATLGAEVRQFQLRATRAGNNPSGRIYTITYSATDASGNKSTASATVIVPHDRGFK